MISARDISKAGVSFKVNLNSERSQHVHFWTYHYPTWENETFDIFNRFLDPDSTYLDIGAWIGPTVLYGAHRAKHVYALEPDVIAFKELTQNINLNPHIASKVTCLNEALGPNSEMVDLYIRTFASDSMSSLIPPLSDKHVYKVRAITIEKLISDNNIDHLSFIKMDIEGGEYSVIPAMGNYLRTYKPTLYLSIHPPFLLEAESRVKGTDKAEQEKLVQTRELLNALQCYKYVYDVNGDFVDRNVILHAQDFCAFLFTDQSW